MEPYWSPGSTRRNLNGYQAFEKWSQKIFLLAAERGSAAKTLIGTFSTDGFQDGYGELDRAGLGIQGAVRTKASENKNSLATKTIPDYGVNEIVGETRTQT